jgi:hypothetical protein
MSDTVKLIVEISKEDLKRISDGEWIGTYTYDNIILNGTPLDDVISKIEKLNPVDYGSMFSYESHNGAKDMKRDILEILDNIGKADIGRK